MIELAIQLAGRSGCDAVIGVGVGDVTDGPFEGVTGVYPLVPDRDTARVAARYAPRMVAVIDLDRASECHGGANEAIEVWGSVVRAALFTVVSSRLPAPEVADAVRRIRANPMFEGLNRPDSGGGQSVVVCESVSTTHSTLVTAPPGFSATAFVTVYNEEDVLETVLSDLATQGVGAYVIDNWSTDDSWDIVKADRAGNVVGSERWPAHGKSEHFDLKAILDRISSLANELGSDWYIKHDADEIRRSPWPGVSLADGLWIAQSTGYNIVDFTVLNYVPTRDGFKRGDDLWSFFEHFEFGRLPGHFRQFKAWRNFGQQIDYARFGSHRISFPGARVFPYKFELHHYPIRSQEHGMRKVFGDRLPRYLPEARAKGWHTQYDDLSATSNFVREPEGLLRRDDETWRRHRVELLSGAGLPRDEPRTPQ